MTARDGERGQVLVEFALAGTVFLLVVFGVIGFGQANYARNSVAEAARVGARYAMTNTIAAPSDCGSSTSSNCLPPIVQHILARASLDPNKLTTTVVYGGSSVDSKYPDCSANPTVGCWVRVTVAYPYETPAFNISGGSVTSSSQMIITTAY
jgi:Flp pilus assembly protein TadG